MWAAGYGRRHGYFAWGNSEGQGNRQSVEDPKQSGFRTGIEVRWSR